MVMRSVRRKGTKYFFPLVAPGVADELRDARGKCGVHVGGCRFAEGVRGKAGDQRGFTAGCAAGERAFVALFDAVGAELEKKSRDVIGLRGGDVEQKLGVARRLVHGPRLPLLRAPASLPTMREGLRERMGDVNRQAPRTPRFSGEWLMRWMPPEVRRRS